LRIKKSAVTPVTTVLFGAHQQGVPVILRELVLPDGLVSPSFTVRDVTTGLSGQRPTSCSTEMHC
uniref:Plug domain-containing protein n=1 Tax=Schistosoma curassoni TaxID=6186 RepID=A0A183KT13_9TREM